MNTKHKVVIAGAFLTGALLMLVIRGQGTGQEPIPQADVDANAVHQGHEEAGNSGTEDVDHAAMDHVEPAPTTDVDHAAMEHR